jgi:hypothetical protein
MLNDASLTDDFVSQVALPEQTINWEQFWRKTLQSRGEHEIFLFSEPSWPAVGPNQAPIQ